jgi:hypothetical protein
MRAFGGMVMFVVAITFGGMALVEWARDNRPTKPVLVPADPTFDEIVCSYLDTPTHGNNAMVVRGPSGIVRFCDPFGHCTDFDPRVHDTLEKWLVAVNEQPRWQCWRHSSATLPIVWRKR